MTSDDDALRRKFQCEMCVAVIDDMKQIKLVAQFSDLSGVGYEAAERSMSVPCRNPTRLLPNG